MLKKSFTKKESEPRHNNTVFALDMFNHKDLGSDIGSGWGFLKKGMKIEPHKHSVKEIYIIIGGKGFMKVANNTVTIQRVTQYIFHLTIYIQLGIKQTKI